MSNLIQWFCGKMVSRTHILWVIVGRLVVATLVLGVAAAVESAPTVYLDLNAVLFSLAVIYFLSSIYLLLAFLTRDYSLQLRLQISGDLLLVTLLIYLSGEVASPYSSLYLVVIAYAALLAGKADGHAAAASSTILYVGMIDLAYFAIIPFARLEVGLDVLNYRIGIVVLGFITVSYLSSNLSNRLKKVREELEEKTGSLADLRVFNENIIESLRSGLITTDLEGNIRTANRSTETLLEISINGLAGRPLTTVLPQESAALLLSQDPELRLEPQRDELWFHTQSGHRKFLGFSVSPLFNQREELVGHIISFQDLTEIKKLREEVAIKDKMSAVGHLAAAIAHEIRNPLASMHGSIQVLRKGLQLEGEDVHLMDIVLRESNRLNKIIEDFLSYARPRRIELSRLNLTEIIDETLSLLKNHPALRKEHEIVRLPNGKPLFIEGDADLMRQVCWNLATNSLKAMPVGGRLCIDADGSDETTVRVRFADTGTGMDAHEMNLIFQPFHSNFSEGVGIGMAIVYQIVTQHGGRVSVESVKGSGTTIKLEFARA